MEVLLIFQWCATAVSFGKIKTFPPSLNLAPAPPPFVLLIYLIKAAELSEFNFIKAVFRFVVLSLMCLYFWKDSKADDSRTMKRYI